MVQFGSGRLGTVISDIAGGWRYELTWDDMLWFARMLNAEPNAGAPKLEWDALLWHYAQRHAWKNQKNQIVSSGPMRGYNLFTAAIRLHSQPINPLWARGGSMCQPGGRGYGQDRCSERAFLRREEKTNIEWDEIREDIKVRLLQWARGDVNNPIPGYIDFAQYGARSSANLIPNGATGHGYQVWGQGRVNGSNAFYKAGPAFGNGQHRGRTDNWPANFVRIEFDGKVSGESEPSETPAEEPANEEFRGLSQGQNSTTETRESLITSDRRDRPLQPPLAYFTVSGSATDQVSNREVISSDSEVIRSNEQRFSRQVINLKNATTLEMAQMVPVIQITTRDENGTEVNLNETIFGVSPYHELLNPSLDDNYMFDIQPERPIASIQSLELKVETPTVGGPTGILLGTLSLKVHSPEKVNTNHPRGKFISYMLRQGFSMRIRFGVRGITNTDERLRNAFQWREQDFFISQHDVVINDDKTYDLKLTILPAADKLFNQINIGESIPFEGGEGGATNLRITEQDIQNALGGLSTDTTENQRQALAQRLRSFQSAFNQGTPSRGYRLREGESEQGDAVFGSVLHGAIQQSRILENPPTQQGVPLENVADALRSIQSVLLTRRFDEMLRTDTYRTTLKGVETMVVDMGRLLWNFVRPELEAVVKYNASNGVEMGVIYSSDLTEEETSQSTARPIRSNLKMIFGNFNSRAGQWAGKPLSMFPVNVNEVFRSLRTNREVGKFSSTINEFVGTISRIIDEPENFIIEQSQPNTNDDSNPPSPRYQIERPSLKYLFYPDPTDETSWIYLVYDSKEIVVNFRKLMESLEDEFGEGSVPFERIKERLDSLEIPYLEMGENGSIIKQASARTTSDDLLFAHNAVQANRNSINVREADGSIALPAGISRDFIAGQQTDPQNVIRATQIIMPIEVTLTTYMMVSAFLFTPIYVFFPTRMFETIYMPYIIDHEIREGLLQTRMTLQPNFTPRNRTST